MTDVYEEDIKMLQKKVTKEVMNEISMKIFDKILEVDLDEIVGLDLTKGQLFIIILAANNRLKDSFRHLIIQNYDLVGKDNKKFRNELFKSMLLQGIIDMENEKKK